MCHARRKYEAPGFIGRYIDSAYCTVLAVTNQRRTGNSRDFRAARMKMIAAYLLRLGEYDVNVALRAEFSRIERLEDKPSRIARTAQGFDDDLRRCHINISRSDDA